MNKNQKLANQFYIQFFIFLFLIVFSDSTLQSSWLPATRLTDNIWMSSTSSGNQNALVADASGCIYVVWLDNRDHNGCEHEVYIKNYSADKGWGPDIRLTFDAIVGVDEKSLPVFKSQDKATPGIVADSAGNLFVSYENTVTRKVEVLTYSAATGSWNFLPTVIGDGGASGVNPVLVAGMNDTVHAVWRNFSDGIPQVCYRKYSPETGWGLVEQLTSFSSEKLTPTIAADASGNLHVAWSDGRDTVGSTRFEIYYKKKPVTGDWGPDTRLSFALSSDSLYPDLVADAGGSIHLVWADDRNGNFEIYYIRWLVSSGLWEAEERLTAQDTVSINPGISVDATGQLHVIWQKASNPGDWGWDQFSLYYKNKSIFWGDDIRISRKGCRGSILSGPGSLLHLVYTARQGNISNSEIFYRMFDPLQVPTSRFRQVVLALDVSGSMSRREDGTSSVGPGDSRLTRAGQAISSFLDHLGLRNSAGIDFGLVIFPASGIPGPSAENIIPGSGSLLPLNETNRLNAINTIIPGLTAGGGTSMVEGLSLANEMLGANSAKKILLLTSDGGQNCPVHGFPPGFFSGFCGPVYSVGMGTASEMEISRLRDIALASGGEFRDATVHSRLDLMGWFSTINQSLLGLESESERSDQIKKDEKKQQLVSITDDDTEIAFDLSWMTPNQKCIDFKLKTPDGQIIDADSVSSFPGITFVSNDTYQIFYLNEEFLKDCKRAGQWSLEIKGNEIEADMKETYRCGVVMDSRLKLLTNFDRKNFFAGESIGIQVAVLEDRELLPANIKITIVSPRQSFGNWMGQNPANAPDLRGIPALIDGEFLSDLEKKSRFLQEKFPGSFDPEVEKTVYLLLDRGTNGDLKADDRIYTAVIHNTRVPGTYTFDIQAEGSTASGQQFRRQKVIQKYLGVKVSEEHTQIKLEETEGDRQEVREFRVSIFPRDVQGNYLGPGFADRIRFFIKDAAFLEPVRDHLDGHYSQHFQIPVSQIPANWLIRIRILHEEMVFCL